MRTIYPKKNRPPTACIDYLLGLGTGGKNFEMKEVGWPTLEVGGGICTPEADEILWGQSPEWCIVP